LSWGICSQRHDSRTDELHCVTNIVSFGKWSRGKVPHTVSYACAQWLNPNVQLGWTRLKRAVWLLSVDNQKWYFYITGHSFPVFQDFFAR
jgi:hypothetical protein